MTIRSNKTTVKTNMTIKTATRFHEVSIVEFSISIADSLLLVFVFYDDV